MATAVIQVTPGEVGLQFKKREQAVQRWMEQAMLDSALQVERRVSKDSPVDTGIYKGSWEVVSALQTEKLSPNVASMLRGSRVPVKIVNDAPYAGVLEMGTRPYWPPFEPLFEWAKRKAGDLHIAGLVQISKGALRTTKSGRTKFKGVASLDENDEKALAGFVRAIQVRVSREGFKPKKIMGKQMDFALKSMQRNYERHLRANLGKKL